VKYSTISIKDAEKQGLVDKRYPAGYGLTTMKNLKDFETLIPSTVFHLSLDADNRKEDMCDTAYRFICKCGLI